jgi:hypothetical protein
MCLHNWYLTYREGNRGINNAWSDWGLAYHQLVKKYFDGDLFIFEFKDQYIEEINKCAYKFPKFKYVDLNTRIFDEIMIHIDEFNFFDDYKILDYEKEYKYDFEGLPFIAIPDLEVEKDKEFILMDHKISKIWSRADEEKKLRQLYVYSIPLKTKYNIFPYKFHVNFFKDNTIKEYDFDSNKLEDTKRWVHNQVNLIEKETEFSPRCLQVKDCKKDFYAIQLCNHRCDCEFRPFKKQY